MEFITFDFQKLLFDENFNKEDLQPGCYLFLIVMSDGSVKTIGSVIGSEVKIYLEVNENKQQANFNCGLWGWYKASEMTSYAPGHEEAEPKPEKIQPSEFFDFVLKQSKQCFEVSKSEYLQQQQVTLIRKQLEQKKAQRKLLLNLSALAFSVFLILYFYLNR